MKDKQLEKILAAVCATFGQVDAMMALKYIKGTTLLDAKKTIEHYFPNKEVVNKIISNELASREENKKKERLLICELS